MNTLYDKLTENTKKRIDEDKTKYPLITKSFLDRLKLQESVWFLTVADAHTLFGFTYGHFNFDIDKLVQTYN